MKNLSLAKKLILAFGVVVAVLAVIVGLAISGFNRSQAQMHQLTEVYGETHDMASGLQIKMLTARRHEKDFIARQDQKYLKSHAETLQAIYTEFTALKQLATEAGIDLNLVSEGEQAVKAYENGFNGVQKQILLQGDAESGIRGDLRKLAHDLEGAIKQADDDKLMVDYLLLRRHEKDYVLREDSKYVAKAREVVNSFTGRLESLSLSADLKKTMAETARNYTDTLAKLADSIDTMKQQYPIMGQAVHDLEDAILKLSDLADQREHEQIAAAEATNARTKLIFYLLGAFALLCSVVAAWAAIRSITGPMKKIVFVMQQLGLGRLGNRTGIDTRDEIGILAQEIDGFAVTLENDIVVPLQQLA